MIVQKLKLQNWRNFHTVDIELTPRTFVAGPNASGKSNLLDVFAFLRDVAKAGGGLQKAVNERGGISKLRVYTGNAFDIVGERKRTNYRVDSGKNWMDETFEIRVRNHKKETANVRVVEHLYRWTNWKVTEQSHEFKKRDAQTIEFPVTVAPDGEQVVTYTVHYSW